jgi:O-antigen/teichoic acid export membrane protein
METPGSPVRLSTRVARGGAWIFALRMGVQFFNVLRLVILARLLAPNDFGVMGIALLGLATLQTFSEPGFRAALVQRKEGAEHYLDTAWTISLLRGCLLCAILVIAAPTVAAFFDAPEATGIVRAIGFSLLLQGFTNSAILYFQKELEFNKQFVFYLSGSLVDFVVAVVAAVVLRNAWALVLGLLAGDVVRLLVSFVVARYRPRLEFSWRKARELWSYGRWITAVGILIFLSTQGDNAVVGKMLGAAALGFYQLAYRISNMPATEFSGLIATVVFPAFAKVQDNLPLLRRSYGQLLQFTALLSFPAAAGIFALAPEFTLLVLGEKWMPMVPAMRILAITGLARSISGPGPLFMAIGKPEIRTKIQTVGFAAMALTIFPLTVRWGIAGAAVAATLRVAVGKSAALWYAVRELRAGKRETVRAILLPLFNSAICLGVVLAIKSYLLPVDGLWQLAVIGIVGMSCYLLIVALFDVIFGVGGIELVRRQFSALRRERHGTG